MTRTVKFLVASLTFALAQNCHADRLYVDADAAPGGDGASWATAFNFLQDALDQTVAGRGDEVWIAAGTYYPDDGDNVTEGNRLAPFTLRKDVALFGGFDGNEAQLKDRDTDQLKTVLSGKIHQEERLWSAHVISLEGNANVDSLIITGGNANSTYHNSTTSRGGGVYTNGFTITIEGCQLLDNKASHNGGAIYGFADVNNSSFVGNSALSGGAVYGSISGNNVIFIENFAQSQGGAIWGDVFLKNSEFSANHSDYFGGAIGGRIDFAGYFEIEVYDCIFSDNTAFEGGAIQGPASAVSSIFLNNRGTRNGGAIRGPAYVSHCIFSENRSGFGGAIYSRGWNRTETSIINSVFAGNRYEVAVVYAERLSIINCTFGNNKGSREIISASDYVKLLNNIIWGNTITFGSSIVSPIITNSLSDVPFSPTIRSKNLIEGGADFLGAILDFGNIAENVLTIDPDFIDLYDPSGLDNQFGTSDDGLRLQEESPAIGIGESSILPSDSNDLDGDGNTVEQTPVDAARFLRIQDGSIDLGAYEYGDLDKVFYTLIVNSNSGGYTDPLGSQIFVEYSSVSVSAFPSLGYAFSNWTGDIASTDNPLEVTITSNLTIEAVFEELPRYTVGSLSGPGYELSLDPVQSFYLSGDTVSVSVILDEGYQFVGWPPDNGQTLEYTFPEIDESTEIDFIPDVQAITFDVAIVESEGGLVWSDRGLTDLPSDTIVEIEARPDRGYEFLRWAGSIESDENPLQVTVTENHSIEAEFVSLPRWTLGTLSDLGYQLTVEPEEAFYLPGETVTVTATIYEGFTLDGWSNPSEAVGSVVEYTFPEIEEDQVLTISPVVGSIDPPTKLWSDFSEFGDWQSGWIGWITSVTPEYFLHLHLGTVYYVGESQESVWLYIYADNIGWVWVGKTLYPYLYSWDREWLLHLENSAWLNDISSGEWFEVTP